MNTTLHAIAFLLVAITLAHQAQAADPRVKDVWYDPQAVVTVSVQRGVVTDIVLEPTEAIAEVASGIGADCAKPESPWCISAQPNGRHLFVKPKSNAAAANNVAVVTNERTHSFRFVVVPDGQTPVYRLTVRAAREVPAARLTPLEPMRPVVSIADRLTAAPRPVNGDYSIAEGRDSQDILPTLVFDDGRFTYLRFPANREVPAIFHVLPDGAETLVNARMEGDLLVADRVSRRLVLRAGSAVVGVWNDAFDLEGQAPQAGTTVPGVERALRAVPTTALVKAARGEMQ